MAAPVPAPIADGPSLSPHQAWLGLIRIFYAPGMVFEFVDRSSAWAVPLVARLLAALVISVVSIQMLGFSNIVRRQFDSMPELQDRIGKERLEQLIQQSSTPVREKLSYGAGVAGAALITLLMAGIFAGGMRIADCPTSYPKLLGVCSYVLWAYSLFMGVILAVVIKLNPQDVDLRNPIALNPGFFYTQEEVGRRLHVLLTSLDLLTISAIALIAYGLTKLTKSLSYATALAIVTLPWLLYVTAKIALTGILPF
jgi:hypothetical protein